MSTYPTSSQFRPLTKKDMEEYEKELKATQEAQAAALQKQLQDVSDEESPTPEPTDPATPQAPATTDEVDWKKRYADQTRHTNELLAKERARIKELEDKMAAQSKQRYATDEELSRFEKEYTEASVLKELIAREAEKIADDKIKALREEAEAEKSVLKKQNTDLEQLVAAHPDYREHEKEDSIFLKWLEKQGAEIQRLADYSQTQDIKGVIAVLNMFKAEIKATKSGSNNTSKDFSKNPVQNSIADIPTPREAKFDVLKWDAEMDAALKSGNKALQNVLMAKLNKARAEGRI